MSVRGKMESGNEFSFFRDMQKKFDRSVEIACHASSHLHGRNGDWQELLSTWVFYKICRISQTISTISHLDPRLKETEIFIDYSSCAALCRNLVDACIMYFYLSENIDSDEWELRKAILDLNDATSRYRMFKEFSEEQVETYKGKVDKIREKIKSCPTFDTLSEKDKEDILLCKRLFINGMRGVIRQMGWEIEEFELFNAYISSHVHCHPVSFYRLAEHSSEDGTCSPANFSLMGFALDFARQSLDACIDRIMIQFPDVGEGGMQSMVDRSPLRPKFKI